MNTAKSKSIEQLKWDQTKITFSTSVPLDQQRQGKKQITVGS